MHVWTIGDEMDRHCVFHNRRQPHIAVSGQAEREHHGTVMWVYKSVTPCLTSYNTVSSRVISATFASKPKDVTVVKCYAPTADKPDKKWNSFTKK